LIFLSSEELRELTDLRIPKAQMRWLQNNAIPFVVSAAGKPKVLRSFVIERLQITTTIAKSNEPNFDAIR
jgi:hypothetical protein